MPRNLAAAIFRRQNDIDPDDISYVDDNDIPWWYTRTGYIVKWSVVFGLITLIGLFLLLSYLHAQRRLKKGLKPRRYHHWMISRRQLARVDPNYAFPQATYTPYPAPPPAYYNMQPMAPPPVYEPPAKGDPAQFGEQNGVQPKPPGPESHQGPARFA